MIQTNIGKGSVVTILQIRTHKAKPQVSDHMLLLNPSHTLLGCRLSPSNVPHLQPALRCLTTTELYISPLFGIYKQAPLDCMLLAICTKQRNPSGQGLQDEDPVPGRVRNSTIPLTFL